MANLQLQFNEVDISQTAPGQARLRLLNAVPDARTVGLGVAGSQQLIADGVASGTVSGYQNVTPGTYDLELRASDSGETLLLAPGVCIDAGQVYDVVALGQAGQRTIKLLPLITSVATPCGESLGIGQATDTCLRVINAAPDAGPIDVYVADAPIVEGLAYGHASDFAAAAHWRQRLRVVPAGKAVDQAIVDMTQNWTADSAAQITVSGLGTTSRRQSLALICGGCRRTRLGSELPTPHRTWMRSMLLLRQGRPRSRTSGSAASQATSSSMRPPIRSNSVRMETIPCCSGPGMFRSSRAWSMTSSSSVRARTARCK